MRKIAILACLLFAAALTAAQVSTSYHRRAGTASVAISLDTTLYSSNYGNTFPLITRVTFVPKAGSNKFLTVGIAGLANANGYHVYIDTVKLIVAGTKLTRLDSSSYQAFRGSRVELWYTANPASSRDTIGVYAHATSGTIWIHAGATVWQGVHQTTPFGTSVRANGSTGGNPTVDVSSATGDVVIDIAGVYFQDPMTATGTVLWNYTSNTNYPNAGQQYKAGATTVTMNWTSTSDPWATVGVALKRANP